MNLLIRPESFQDYEAIRQIHHRAFKRDAEGLLVDSLRKNSKFSPEMSLIAFHESQAIGHILFCPLLLQNEKQTVKALSLGPVAVLPEYQNQGVGNQLIWQGLEMMKSLGFEAVLVLGDRHYYERFGFNHELAKSIDSPYAGEHFMAIEWMPEILQQKLKATYPQEFEEV